MDERLKTNLTKWNAVVPVHARSKMYDVAGFKAGRISLYELELAEVGDVRAKSLLHLQCHFGLDTMSWARLGAEVTGLDFSDEAIKLARSLSNEIKIPARFVCADIYDLPSAVDQQFDIVFTSYGPLLGCPICRAGGRSSRGHSNPADSSTLLTNIPLPVSSIIGTICPS
jgi:SAM-dependent methyltransferase